MSKQLQRIIWKDARSEDGWTERGDIDMHVARITTLGHVVDEDSDVVCIASSQDARTSQYSGIMVIPVSCILSRKEIQVADNVLPLEGVMQAVRIYLAERKRDEEPPGWIYPIAESLNLPIDGLISMARKQGPDSEGSRC